MLNDFEGYHSEWNLASPGGWDYQRLTITADPSLIDPLKKKKLFPDDYHVTLELKPDPVSLFLNLLPDNAG